MQGFFLSFFYGQGRKEKTGCFMDEKERFALIEKAYSMTCANFREQKGYHCYPFPGPALCGEGQKTKNPRPGAAYALPKQKRGTGL
jgi:hypothetical protein